jgi:phosphoserine phosphatase RsbU/P
MNGNSTQAVGSGNLAVGPGTNPVYQMACLEIWSGNTAVETPVELPGLSGWVHSKPVEPATVGGDVYYLSVCSAGLVSRIVLADVAGHGQEVGAAAMLVRDLLRQHVNAFDQSELMRGINEAFGSTSDEFVQYATAAVLGYYSKTRELVFTSAGHPHPLWYRANQKSWEWLHEETPHAAKLVDGLPLGLIPGTDYMQTAVRLGLGDLVVLYTDGVSEAVNEEEQELGYEGLLGLARALPTETPKLIGSALLEAVQRFRGTARPFDDRSILIFEQTDNPRS